jgi:hypothetical protein
MPKNSSNVQILIPRSRFNIGDLVQYTIAFDETSITYYGQVETRCWVDESDRRYWEYTVITSFINQDSVKSWAFTDSDCVLEYKLKHWDGVQPSISIKKNTRISDFGTMQVLSA